MTGQFDLAGSIALVTGGSAGLGRAMAEALIEGGARVAIAGRSDRVFSVAEEIGVDRQNGVMGEDGGNARNVWLQKVCVQYLGQDSALQQTEILHLRQKFMSPKHAKRDCTGSGSKKVWSKLD